MRRLRRQQERRHRKTLSQVFSQLDPIAESLTPEENVLAPFSREYNRIWNLGCCGTNPDVTKDLIFSQRSEKGCNDQTGNLRFLLFFVLPLLHLVGAKGFSRRVSSFLYGYAQSLSDEGDGVALWARNPDTMPLSNVCETLN